MELFGLSLMTDLEKAFGMSTNNITNATLTELSTVNPFRVRFHVEDGKALEDPYSLEYSFDFIQA